MANEDRVYLDFLRKLPCSLAEHGTCEGPVHAHHPQGGKGFGQRNHDHRAISLCTKHHCERHSLSGYFRDFRKADVRAFEKEHATRCRQLYLGLGPEASF